MCSTGKTRIAVVAKLVDAVASKAAVHLSVKVQLLPTVPFWGIDDFRTV